MSEVTYSLKGFVGYGALADNRPDVIAALGELSTYSRTFATDRKLFSTETGSNPNSTVDLTVFSSRKGTDGAAMDVPLPYSQLLLQVSAWSYLQAYLGTFTNSPDSYRVALLAEFAGKITDVTVGAMVTNGDAYLPGAVTFYINPDGLGATWQPGERADLEDSRIKLWFADDRFRREYDEFSYIFIAPIMPLDSFFLPSAEVRDLVSQRTAPELFQDIRDKTDKKPTTVVRSDIFNYVDPVDPSFTFPTDWTYLIYGAAGDNIDAIKEELIDWILDNSEHDREEWAKIFPDIFTATEFIVAPAWNQFAVENSPVNAGVYSPIMNLIQARSLGHDAFTGTGYTAEHIDTNMCVAPIPFKSLALAICGGPENRGGKKRFEQHWADFMNVASSNNTDFGRMSLATQQLCLMLEAMLKVAETMTEFSDIPTTMTRLKRTNADGRTYLYVVKSYLNVQYLVASAQSVQAHFPPSGYEELDLANEGAEGMTAMPNGTRGVAYETWFNGIGGTGVYTYQLVDAAYGPITNHSIDPVTGAYTATLGAGGDANVKVRVVDSSGAFYQRVFSLHVIATVPQT